MLELEKRKLEGTTGSVGTRGNKMSVLIENIFNRFYNSNTDLFGSGRCWHLAFSRLPEFRRACSLHSSV
jgi:hypothetical protein